MKKLYLFIVAAVMLVGMSSLLASGGDDTYYVNNNTGWSIGTVTLYSTNSTHVDLAVDQTYSHHATVSAPVNAIKVNGTTLTYPNQGPVTLPSGHVVKYNWFGGSSTYNSVGLFDPDED